MKLSLDSKQLRNAVNLAVAAATISDDPRVQECHIVPLNGKVFFYASGHFTVCAAIEFEADAELSDILSFHLQQLSHILSPFDSGMIEINSTKTNCRIAAKKLSASLSLIVSEEILDPTFSYDAVAVVEYKEFHDAVMAIAQIADNPVMINGLRDNIQFTVDGSILTAQATDGAKYGASQINSFRSSEECEFTLRAPTLRRILASFSPVNNRVIISRRGKNLISIGTDDYFFTLPKVDNNFKINPGMARQLLTGGHQMFYCQREELVDAIESAASLYKSIKDAKQDVKIEMDISKFSVTISTCICPRLNAGSLVGTDRISRDIDYEIGSDSWHNDIITLHFNADLLRSVVRASRAERLAFWFFGPKHAAVIVPDIDDTEDIFAAMPLGNVQEQPKRPISAAVINDKKYYDDDGKELPF